MAIVWADFPSGQQGLYGTDSSDMLNGVWAEFFTTGGSAQNALVADPDTNVTGNVYKILADSFVGNTGARIVNPGGTNALSGIGFRLWCTALPSANAAAGNAQWRFSTSGNVTIAYCRVLADGSIGAYNSANTLLGQSIPCVTANAYHHIETKVLRHASAGTLEVRVNGAVKLNLTGLALGAGDIGMTRIEQDSRNISGSAIYYKDFVYWDGVGTEAIDFQGSVAVRDLYTDADISLNWTPSTGSTGWDILDKTAVDDTTYISADDTPPAAAKFSLTDLPEDVTSVRALLPIVRAVKTDGGDCNVQVGITPNDTNWDDGSDRPMTTAFTFWWDVSHLSPATAAAWTPTEVNAAYVRVDRTL